MFETFLNPGYVAAGAALVSLPIAIHLINRMRYRRVRWAAMEFLLKSQKRNRRRLIIEQMLLLLMRCLLVLMAVLLASRYLGFSFAFLEPQNTLHVVVVDEYVDELAQAAVLVEQTIGEPGVLGLEPGDHLRQRARLDFHELVAA